MIELAYICSAARSGSTLLTRMIGMHPHAVPGGEVSRLSKSISLEAICSCGNHVQRCCFWAPVVDRLSRDTGIDLWATPYKLDLGLIRAVSEVDHERQTRLYLAYRKIYMMWLEFLDGIGIELIGSRLSRQYRHWLNENLRVHEALRAQSGRRLVVDSSKGFRFAVGFYKLRPRETRIILLTRDGRGVLASHLRSGMELADGARVWKRYYSKALDWLDRGVDGNHVIRVRYEDLTNEPERELNRIFRFLELPEMKIEGKLRLEECHIIEGNRNTLRGSTEVKPDTRWKTELTDRQLDFFSKSSGTLMAEFGYSAPDRSDST